MKDIIEKEVREEKDEEPTEDNIDLTATENEKTLEGAYRSFVIPGMPKADIDSFVDWVKLPIKALIKKQLKNSIDSNTQTLKAP